MEHFIKRKSLFLLAVLTVAATLLSGCKASDSVDNSAVKSEATEATAVESEATEEAGVITETVEENTTETTEVAETTDIKNVEPLSEKDLAFSFLGYDTYNEYVEAGNDGAA